MAITQTIGALTHWGWATHICIGKLTIIGSDNGLSPGRRQAIIWAIAGILLIGPLGTNFSEILIGIQTFSIKKMHLKMSSAKWRLFCLGPNELIRVTRTLLKISAMGYNLHHSHCCKSPVENFQGNNKENTKSVHYCSFDWWIPLI